MPVSDDELAQAVALIVHDVAATLDWNPRRATTFTEEIVGVGVGIDGWDAAWGSYAIKLAEDIQQQLHDTFVDTTWPACPLHPQHPLWLDGEHDRAVWRCTLAAVDIAPLGSLFSEAPPPGPRRQ
jgi:hypothetical protein